MNGEKDFTESIPLFGEPPVKQPAPGALEIQDFFDRVEWLNQSANPVAFAPYLVQAPLGPPRAVLVQWAVGDRTVPNPTTDSILRAGDLYLWSSVYHHERVAATLPERFRNNPHGFLTWTTFPDVADIGARRAGAGGALLSLRRQADRPGGSALRAAGAAGRAPAAATR